jgi:hypothetical protein
MAAKDKAKDRQREERLAAALRENLRRRKAQARQILPGTGRGTAEGGGGAESAGADPSVSADALPPPRSRED